MDVNQLIEEIRLLPPEDRRRIRVAIGDATVDGPSELPGLAQSLDYERRLLQWGLIEKLRPRRLDPDEFNRFSPIEICGKPLSETIIEERR